MIKIFVMKTCPDCTHVKKLAENDPRFEITDIGEHVRNTKQFITLRDSSPAFDDIRGRGTVGIPCFVLEDGRITFSPRGSRHRGKGRAYGQHGAHARRDIM